MKVGYFQFDPVFGEIKRNLDFVSERLAKIECDLLVLPELFNTGYQFASADEAKDLSEEIPTRAACNRQKPRQHEDGEPDQAGHRPQR